MEFVFIPMPFFISRHIPLKNQIDLFIQRYLNYHAGGRLPLKSIGHHILFLLFWHYFLC